MIAKEFILLNTHVNNEEMLIKFGRLHVTALKKAVTKHLKDNKKTSYNEDDINRLIITCYPLRDIK